MARDWSRRWTTYLLRNEEQLLWNITYVFDMAIATEYNLEIWALKFQKILHMLGLVINQVSVR